MSRALEESFPIAYRKLKDLFGSIQDSTMDRLNNVYKECEEAWNRNLDRLKGKKVEYVLIGEAAPWPQKDTVRYFYTTFDKRESDKPINWIRSVWKVFFREPPPDDVDRCLVRLAERKFLLLDSLPFAMSYGKVRKKEVQYKSLVRACLPYFLTKIGNREISWSSDVKLAFAFRKNGEALVEALPNGIRLSSGQHILLERNMIAATGSGFPTRRSLAEKWLVNWD